METFLKWPHVVMFLHIITWTNIIDVSGQKYYINLYGPNSFEGTIEFSDGLSWFVLHHQGWNDKNAEVTCRMLGYSGSEASATFGSILHTLLRPVWKFQFHCNGNETSLSECKTTRLNSTTGNISVGVKCPSHPAFEDNEFLLRSTSDNKISKVNIITMSGTVDTDTSCFTDVPGEVAYDPIYDRIVYFKDSSLWGCSFGGGKSELYRFVSTMSVRSLALDNNNRNVFYFSNGKILTIKLDDASTIPTFVLNTTHASSMTVDPINRELYWVNLISKSIARALYNGSSISDLSAISWNGAVSNIAITDDNIFWSDTRIDGLSNSNNLRIFTNISPCSSLYVIGKWLYCSTFSGVLRLEKNGKCGGHYGPLNEASKQIIQHNDDPNTSQDSVCENFYINLYGIKPHEGTIVLSNGIDWHTLCSDGWDDEDASVACRMLGYSGEGARTILNTNSSSHAFPSWGYQFHCEGDESVLSECKTSSLSSRKCYRAAGVQCSEHKVVRDFLLKTTMKGIIKTNPFTMSGYLDLNNPCKLNSDVVYDSVNDQFLFFQSGSLWGCRWDDGNEVIRTNTSVLSYPALDSEDRLLFGYSDNDILSLRFDDTSAEPAIVVHGTTVQSDLALDTERNEIYWWTYHYGHRINRVSYHGDSEVQVWGSSSPLKMITFQGDSLFYVDPQHQGVFRRHHTSGTLLLYEQFGTLSDKCAKLYVDDDWIYCTEYLWGILRLQKDGKGGNFFGPIEYTRTAFRTEILYFHSPGSQCKVSNYKSDLLHWKR